MLQLNVPRPSLANLYKSLFPWCLVGKINHLAKPAKIKQGDLKQASLTSGRWGRSTTLALGLRKPKTLLCTVGFWFSAFFRYPRV
ncbi:hypothetical protein GWI33_000064 [Rhynchophorus ferrugineus]|uniref:Uncharacterized protein n=1 Tax=Rhynchophorus ferrugineus TaxID=354439 RepID=A0A834IX36_RHYFE|nr:hypothetical protein GWI33_000064 [Rhynchophorus ferrugineus]